MHDSHKHLKANDCVDDDDEQDEKRDMEQWDHSHHYSVQHNLNNNS